MHEITPPPTIIPSVLLSLSQSSAFSLYIHLPLYFLLILSLCPSLSQSIAFSLIFPQVHSFSVPHSCSHLSVSICISFFSISFSYSSSFFFHSPSLSLSLFISPSLLFPHFLLLAFICFHWFPPHPSLSFSFL